MNNQKNVLHAGILGMLLLLTCSQLACRKKKMTTIASDDCPSVSIAGSRLSIDTTTETFHFVTNGGGRIKLQLGGRTDTRSLIITHDNYSDFSLELWGVLDDNGVVKTSANHENLNGKHLKDRFGTKRSIIFPDGAKITLTTASEYGPLVAVSIYDGAQVHRIEPNCRKVSTSVIDAAISAKLDAQEPDGETATFEINETGLIYYNIYTEATVGNKVEQRVDLGSLRRGFPNLINDHFDDPRIGHT